MKRIAFFACLIFLVGVSTVFSAELEVEQKYPVMGEGVKVNLKQVDDPGSVSLTAVYRPNSATSIEKEIGPFKADGSRIWKPEAPGITTLIVKDSQGKKVASENVATQYPSTPASGVIVMVLAGMLLFGGAGWSLNRALSE